MVNGLRSESYKLLRTRIFGVLLLFTGIFSFLSTSLIFLEEHGFLTEQSSVSVEVTDTAIEGFPVLMISVLESDAFFIYIFAALLSAFFIAGEYTNGTIKNIVSTGSKRSIIHLSKLSMIWLGTVLVFLFTIGSFAAFQSIFLE